MLELTHIKKQYRTGALVQQALDDVSVSFRDSEFVAILGPSGSGKTTLLNIIGGLDTYDSGDLRINGVSTKEYKDRDWDTYRNHTIGFVFQSYNLISHQTVLANVELALTIGGVPRAERKRRARQALTQVGLEKHLHKLPNQLSGGQMQRVAIARALVNDPEILLADEPTGALDTDTGIEVMELLKKVAEDRLVVMVTHNPELARKYATRIVRLRDGTITDDSAPFSPKEEKEPPEPSKKNRSTMRFLTSLSLSLSNLRAKKGRTFLTAFASSIGIIGIALILAISTGVNQYIDDIQAETMTSYPITISSETMDVASLMGQANDSGQTQTERADAADGVAVNTKELEDQAALSAGMVENDLASFQEYLLDPENGILSHVGKNGIVYSYGTKFYAYEENADGEFLDTDREVEEEDEENALSAMMSDREAMMSSIAGQILGGSGSDTASNFSELPAGQDGSAVSTVVSDNYDLIYGSWPDSDQEAVLALDEDGSLSAEVLFQLGFLEEDTYRELQQEIEDGEEPEQLTLDYDTFLGKTFWIVPVSSLYTEEENGTFIASGVSELSADTIQSDGIPVEISGIIRPKGDAFSATVTTAVAYTSELADRIISYTDSSAVVTAQEETPDVNVLTGFPFTEDTDAKKIADIKEYIQELSPEAQAALLSAAQSFAGNDNSTNSEAADVSLPAMGSGNADLAEYSAMTGDDSDTDGSPLADAFTGTTDSFASAGQIDTTSAVEAALEAASDADLLSLYDLYLGGSSYEDNMEVFGKVDRDVPTSISIYTDSFEDKDAIAEAIRTYNSTVPEDEQITYTDYVALMTTSLTSIVNVVTYVLIAFVAVSLIVSCIMIGIITRISVLERTREIGILRALGASRRNISQVFNAETILIGFLSGCIGIGVAFALLPLINNLIRSRMAIDNLTAVLPPLSAVILVLISVAITLFGGLIPARKAAKQDPVVALRTE